MQIVLVVKLTYVTITLGAFWAFSEGKIGPKWFILAQGLMWKAEHMH
jgi:hypothetical protein